MIFEDALSAYLRTKGTLAGARVFFMRAPQNLGTANPYAVIDIVNPDPLYSHAGETDIRVYRYQIDTIAKSQSQAKELSEQIRTELSGFRGSIGNGFDVCSAFVRTQRTSFSEVNQVFVINTDYDITYRAA